MASPVGGLGDTQRMLELDLFLQCNKGRKDRLCLHVHVHVHTCMRIYSCRSHGLSTLYHTVR